MKKGVRRFIIVSLSLSSLPKSIIPNLLPPTREWEGDIWRWPSVARWNKDSGNGNFTVFFFPPPKFSTTKLRNTYNFFGLLFPFSFTRPHSNCNLMESVGRRDTLSLSRIFIAQQRVGDIITEIALGRQQEASDSRPLSISYFQKRNSDKFAGNQP